MKWYETWFSDPLYLEVYSHRDEEEAAEAIALFTSVVPLRSGARVLDLACGTGRHSQALADRGFRIAAVDLSFQLLSIAEENSRNKSHRPSYVRADMRRLPFRRSFEAVVQLFTAFGYFVSDEENAAVFAQVADVLQPGGYYMLDFLNADVVLAALEPETQSTVNGRSVIQKRRIVEGRVEKEIALYSDGELVRKYWESVRLYTKDDLCAMLPNAGLEPLHVLGSYSGEPFSANSPRCIIISQAIR